MTQAAEDRLPLERYGVEPVPPELRTVAWYDLFAMIFTFCLSPVFFVLGALAVSEGGLPLWWAAGACALGQAAGALLLVVVGRVGVDYGLPGQVALRATFGEWGARGLTSPYRMVAATYWFAVQALAGALAIRAIARALTGHELGLVPVALATASVAMLLAVVGFDAMRYVVRVVLPVMLVFTGVIVALYIATADPRYDVSRVLDSPDQTLTWTGAATFVTVMWAGALTAVTNAADFTRYMRSRREMALAQVAGGVGGTFIAAWVGAYAAVATGSTDPFLAATELTGTEALLVVLLIAIVVQTTSVNIMNLYTAGLSLVNSAPRLGRLASTAAVGSIAVALSAFPDVINGAERWITHLGTVGAPLAGVIVADYSIRKRGRIDVPALFDRRGRYRYLGGLNPAALGAVAAAVAVYYVIPDSWLKAAWGVLAGAVLYLALAALQEAVLPQTRGAVELEDGVGEEASPSLASTSS